MVCSSRFLRIDLSQNLKTYNLGLVIFILIFITTDALAREYNRANYPYSRAAFGCASPLSKIVDINNGETILCKFADLDHRVSLKQGFDANLSDDKLKKLAVDKDNIVWTRSEINRAKGPLSSEHFEKILVNKNEYDGRRFNRHLRGSIATKQKYGIPLDNREKEFAYRFLRIPPTKRVTKLIPAKSFNDAIELVGKRYGSKVAQKLATRLGGTFVPGPGWVVTGSLLTIDFGWWYFTGECAVCDAALYFMELTDEKYVTNVVDSPVPIIPAKTEYEVLPTSYAEIKAELDHVRKLVAEDQWKLKASTKAHLQYLQQLEAELTKLKFS